jgi:CRP/FNR family transcriptional regulator, cyclic AMP receptor protein
VLATVVLREEREELDPYMYRSHKEEEARLLSMVDILEPLDQEELEELSHRCPQRTIEAGHFLYTPGDPSQRLFVLKRGKVRLYRVAGGSELTLAVVGEGTLFGEIALSAEEHLHQGYAQAMEPSVVLSMRVDDLKKLILGHPEVGLELARVLSERLRLYEKRLEDISLKQVPARLASLLLIFCESEGVMSADDKQIKIPTHYTHDHLGTMIGARRGTVTRAFGYLQELGAVEVRRRRIYLLDTEALQRVANL